MSDFPDARLVDTGGTRLAVYEAGDGPPVLLVHGWPEIAYSWKNQIPALAAAGYRPIAIDLKGFGRSDAPTDPASYTSRQLTDDFAALLDALELDRAIFCGHDWGGALVWAMAQYRPDRVRGVIGVCTPLKPRPPAPPLEIIRKRLGDQHYFIQFQERGKPEKLFASDIDKFFRLMFRPPAQRARWAELIPEVYDLPARFARADANKIQNCFLSDADLAIYRNAYRRSGFHGGINLYRNIDRNWEDSRGCAETVHAPSLFIGAELDLFLPPETAQGMEALVPDLEKHILSDCGHWVMWEQPAALNAIVTDWLSRRFPPR